MIRSLARELPLTHRATLLYLFNHLTRVAAHGAVNKMHVHNLAIVFGPVR